MPPTNDPPNCPPVWQYALIMTPEMRALARLMIAGGQSAEAEQIIGLSEGLEAIGGYHSAEEIEPLAIWTDKLLEEWRPMLLKARPQYAKIATWLQPKVVELREMVEKLTGWVEPASS